MGARRPCSRGSHTAAALAKRMGTCPRTIRNHVAEPRRDYEARSIARLQPWLERGISRATWYRRIKSAQGQAVGAAPDD
jgi:hypothetical protein